MYDIDIIFGSPKGHLYPTMYDTTHT